MHPERLVVGADTGHREPAQRLVQCGDAVPSLAVQAHHEVRPVPEDLPDQRRQRGAGTDLHEGTDSGGVHGFDLIDEPDRCGEICIVETPLRFRVMPGALKVIVPKPQPATSG